MVLTQVRLPNDLSEGSQRVGQNQEAACTLGGHDSESQCSLQSKCTCCSNTLFPAQVLFSSVKVTKNMGNDCLL